MTTEELREMAKTEEIRVRVTPEEKERAKALFDSCGLTTSAAVTMFIRQSLQEGGLPFVVETKNAGGKLRNVK